jgi:glyoxylase-like metal-dependent hydrolase (beta-lactamase superfamily II)
MVQGSDMNKFNWVRAFFFFACVASTAQVFAQQPVTTGPLVKEGVTTKVSDHVYVIPDGGVGGVPNVGIIVGSTSTLIIDTGLGKQNGEAVLREAKKLSGSTALYLVTTHVHPEHDLGAHAFPASTKLIRSSDQVAEIASAGMRTADVFRGRSPQMAQLLEGAEFRKADVTFDGEHMLDLGGVKARILAMGPNHTAGDTVVVVDGEGVVFTGDVAMKALPAFASDKSSAKNWLKSLDRLEALKPRVVVPSHGPLGDAKYIADYRTFIARVQARAGALKKEGKSVEQAVESITAELKAEYPETGRMAGAIRAAYREAP